MSKTKWKLPSDEILAKQTPDIRDWALACTHNFSALTEALEILYQVSQDDFLNTGDKGMIQTFLNRFKDGEDE